MISLQRRLDAVAKKGSLGTADLALWLDLSYQTVRSYRRGVIPQEARYRQIDERLKGLERALRTDSRLPVPLSVRARERKEYLLGVMSGVSRKRK